MSSKCATCTCGRCSPTTPSRGERFAVEAAGLYLDYSKNRITDETVRLLVALADACGLRERIEAMFRGEQINTTEERAVLHVALRAPRGESIVLDGDDVVPARARGARSDGRVRRSGPGRPLAWAHRPARAHGHQYRDRRLRSRPGHGLRGAEALQRAGPDLPLRVERGRHRLRRSHARSRSRRDPVHRLVQDVHHARDDDERAHGATVGARRAGRRAGHQPALRRGVHQRRAGGGIRHRHGQHVRVLGLGRRPLLDGLGDRIVDHDRHRSGEFPRDAGRLPRHGRAFPDGPIRAQPARPHGAAHGLVHRTSSALRPSPSCPTTST